MINLRDVEELTRRLTRIRERAGNPQIALLGEANR
jgi:hypothetical protein